MNLIETKWPYIWAINPAPRLEIDGPISWDGKPYTYCFKVNGHTSPAYSTLKQAQIELMWYLIENRLLTKGEAIRL